MTSFQACVLHWSAVRIENAWPYSHLNPLPHQIGEHLEKEFEAKEKDNASDQTCKQGGVMKHLWK
jgi:hypothetical protein